MSTATGAVLTNLDGLVFNKGYLFGTISGHPTDSIEFGALQNVRLNHTFTFSDIYGPESLSMLGRGVEREELSGNFQRGVISPEQFILMNGGSMVYNGGSQSTVYTKLVNEEPLPFNVHFESQPSSPDFDIVLYRCTCSEWNLEANNRAWILGGSTFMVHGQAVADGGKLFEFTKPGNLTNSS